VSFFTRLKAGLMPYLFATAVTASKLGIPSVRSMVMEFANDPTCAYLDRQYMLGDSLLVAPIFNDKGEVQLYLPKGKWTNFLTGEIREGGNWYNEKHNYLSLPLYVRENSIIAVGARDDDAVYDYSDGVTLKAYELTMGGTASCQVYDDRANLELEAKISRMDDAIVIDLRTSKSCRVLLVNLNNVASVENGSFSINGNDTLITAEKSGIIKVYLKKL